MARTNGGELGVWWVLFFFFFFFVFSQMQCGSTSDEVMGAKQPLQSPTTTVIWNHSDLHAFIQVWKGWPTLTASC